MLNAVINWSLHNRLIVVAVAALFAALGLWSLPELPIDAFPDTTPAQIQINTVAVGIGPEEVERQFTFPVEQAISGLPRVEQVRSLSRFGLSQVIVTFIDGTDIFFARQQVSERLVGVELPEGSPRPRLGPVATGLGEVFHYTLRSDKRDLLEMRTLQDWTIRPPLRTVPGVAEINSWGGQEKQYQIRLDPDRLLARDASFDQVQEAARKNNLSVGGGHIAQTGTTYLVRGLARPSTIDEIEDIVVSSPRAETRGGETGTSTRLRDLARVQIGGDLRVGGVTAQGKGEVVLGLGFTLMGENTADVTRRLKERLAETVPNLPADVEVTTVYDRTRLVDSVIDTVRRNLFEGGLFVIAVLFLFLGNLRAGLIVALAIPLSMLFAFSGMLRFGVAGSLLSLGAIDFGLVVDSSVVMIENCVRHMAHDKDDKRSKVDVIRDAAIEVRGPTTFGELIILIVYLPILTLEGVEGKLFRPMALTVVFALVGSMVLSLTLMPVLASLLLPRRMDERDPWPVRLLRWMYAPLLKVALHFPFAVLLATAGLLGLGGLLAANLGSEFVPRLSEGAFVVNVLRVPGTDLDESLRANTLLEKKLLAEFPDEIEFVWSRCGTAEVATDPMGPEETDMFITLKPTADWKRATTQDELRGVLRKELEEFPGQKSTISQPIQQRIDEMISGVKADVAIKLFGDDLEILGKRAEAVEKILKSIDGAADVTVPPPSGLPVVEVRLRQDELGRYGIPASAVLDQVEALAGKVVGNILEGQLRFPLVIRLPEHYRRSPEALAALLIVTPTGDQVPLSRLADVRLTEGPAKVEREWGQRRVVVSCNVQNRDVGGFVEEARERVTAELGTPTGRDRIVWGGQFENLARAKKRLVLVLAVALGLIFLLLYITYKHLGDVCLVFTAIPLASVGGVAALYFRELPFSISAGVGFIALFGVSVLNSMVMVTFIRQQKERGSGLEEAIEKAALTRFRPVLMTALVASFGFVPMALSHGVGAEVQRPLATVVVGGVISSTLLTLFVLPVMYRLFGTRGA
jgi:cobalt-zinc-cadmium resistance protein CzcA